MTTDMHTKTTGGPAPGGRMDPMRKVALAGGVAYLVTFAGSIPALWLYADVLDHSDYIVTPCSDTSLLWGAWLEVITAVACIATAVALYPVTRRVSRTAALGFVTARVVEAVLILVGVLSLLSIVTLREDLAGATGAEATSLVTTGQALVALHDWTFLLGPGVIPGINALCLGYVMYKPRLVPRIIPTIGLVGWDQLSTIGGLSALPIAVLEFSLGVWLTVKGFRPTALASVQAESARVDDAVPVG